MSHDKMLLLTVVFPIGFLMGFITVRWLNKRTKDFKGRIWKAAEFHIITGAGSTVALMTMWVVALIVGIK